MGCGPRVLLLRATEPRKPRSGSARSPRSPRRAEPGWLQEPGPRRVWAGTRARPRAHGGPIGPRGGEAGGPGLGAAPQARRAARLVRRAREWVRRRWQRAHRRSRRSRRLGRRPGRRRHQQRRIFMKRPKASTSNGGAAQSHMAGIQVVPLRARDLARVAWHVPSGAIHSLGVYKGGAVHSHKAGPWRLPWMARDSSRV